MGEVAIIIGFMSYYIPSEYAVHPAILLAWKVLLYVTATFGGIMLLVSGRINRRNVTILSYYFWLFIAVRFLAGNGELKLGSFIQCTGLFAFLEYLLQTRDTRTVMKYFLIAGVAVSLIHFASFLVYMDTVGGMLQVMRYRGGRVIGLQDQNYYFLTYDNDSVHFFVTIIVLLFYYSVYYNSEAIVYFSAYSAFVLFMYYYKMAATAIVASTYLVGVLAYLYVMRRNRQSVPSLLCNYRLSILGGIAAEIVPLMIVGNAALGSIVAVLGKSVTFSGRDRVWAGSVLYFLRNPIFGMGIEDNAITAQRIGINHCHNLVLEHLYRGGIVAMFLFLFMLKMYAPPKPDKYKTAIFCAGIIAFFITAAFDWRMYVPLPFLLFVFNYYANREEELPV